MKTDFKLSMRCVTDVDLAFRCWHRLEVGFLPTFHRTMLPPSSGMMIKAVWSFETSARSQLVHGVSIQNQDQQHQIPSIKESTD